MATLDDYYVVLLSSLFTFSSSAAGVLLLSSFSFSFSLPSVLVPPADACRVSISASSSLIR